MDPVEKRAKNTNGMHRVSCGGNEGAVVNGVFLCPCTMCLLCQFGNQISGLWNSSDSKQPNC